MVKPARSSEMVGPFHRGVGTEKRIGLNGADGTSGYEPEGRPETARRRYAGSFVSLLLHRDGGIRPALDFDPAPCAQGDIWEVFELFMKELLRLQRRWSWEGLRRPDIVGYLDLCLSWE